ncbi:beta strand repeat-containing protein [Dyella nitratireducens]|uniref:beta strand repeat-containing protein n=2 Tax=Dyella nitratireducens TaxID=1849580 RepID=UPI003C2FEF4B
MTSAQYQEVLQAINDSPALLASLNADAASGMVTGINLQSTAGSDFDTTKGVININVQDLNNDISGFSGAGENSLIFVLAHEDQHAEDWGLPGNQASPAVGTVAYNEQQAQQDLSQQIQNAGAGGLSSAAQTAWAAGYQGIGLDDEAQANISGWNAVLSKAEAQNGGALSSAELNNLINATPQSYSLFTNAGGQITTYGGITPNTDGSITATPENIDAASHVVANIATSTTGDPYALFYGQEAIAWIAAYNDNQASVSYSGLGLTTGATITGLNSTSGQGGGPLTSLQIDQGLSSYFSSDSAKASKAITLVDNDDNSTVTYTPTVNSFGVDGTYTQTIPAPAASVTSVTTDAGLNSVGDEVYQEVDTLATNGILSSDISGAGDVANLTNAIVAASANSTFILNGSGNTVTVGSGGALTVQGNNNAVDATGGAINVSAGDTGNTYDGDQTTINAAADFAGTIDGTDNSIYLASNSSTSLTLSGTNESVSSTGNQISLVGTGTSASVTGVNTVDVNGSNQSLTLATNGDTVDTSAGDTGEMLNGSGFTLNGGAGQFTGTITGGGNTFNLDADSGSSLSLSGTSNNSDIVNGASAAVTLAGSTQANVNGNSNTINEVSNDVLGVYGGGNTIDAGAGEYLVIGNTNDNLDIVNSTGDAGGGTSSDGFGTGISLNVNAQANVDGSGNMVYGNTSDVLGVYGGGNTIDAGAGEYLVIGNTNDNLDIVNSTGDAGGGTSSDGFGTGISLNVNAQANVDGSGNMVYGNTSDVLGVYGGGNTIDAGAGEYLVIGNTNDNLDIVNSTGDAGGGTSSDGFGTGISLNVNAQANVDGSGNMVYGNTSDVLGVYGGGNTIDAGAGEYLVIGNTNDNLDIVNSNGDAGGGTSSDGFGTGISLNVNAQANVDGSGNMVYGNTSDVLGVYGGGNTIDAGAGEYLVIGNTNDNLDIVNSTGDAGGGTSSDGFGTGISLNVNAQANVDGSGNMVYGNTSDVLGVYGGGNTIDAGAGEYLVIGNTNDNLDIVNSTGDAGGGTSSDGFGTGISLNVNAQANVDGSGNMVYGNTSDVLGVYGGGNTIDAGAGEYLVIGNTNDNLDIVNSNGDAGGGTSSDGFGTGISLNVNAQANVDGSGNMVYGNTSDVLGVYGGGNTIDAGANELLVVGNTDSNVDTINATNDTNGGTTSNGQGTGIFLDAGSDANVNGSGDDVNLQAHDTLTLNGNNDIASGSDDTLALDGTGDTIDISHATIDVSGDDGVTIDGSDDKIVGNSGDDFTITGTDDTVDASDASITFDGTNTGDYVSGSGDSGSNWDDPTGSGGYSDPGTGYYGYGLTKWKNKSPSAAQIAKAEHSDSVYEGAKWADQTITWSFASAGNGYSDAITNSAEQTAVAQAFQAWAKASGLNVDEVAAGSKADIEVGFSDLNPASTNQIGLTKYSSQAGVLTGANVALEDPSQAALTTDASGQLEYANTDATFEQVALHEIGHALGLADTDVAGSIMNAVLGTDNQAISATDATNVQKLYANTSSSNAELSQVHQLVQAMSTFDAGEQGIDLSPMAELYLQKEQPLVGSLSHVRAA